MWNIYGKTYNLHLFLDKHPGGKNILEACKGDDDLTATFESYHVLCNSDKIKDMMKQYEIDTDPINHTYIIPSFKPNDFYKTVHKE